MLVKTYKREVFQRDSQECPALHTRMPENDSHPDLVFRPESRVESLRLFWRPRTPETRLQNSNSTTRSRRSFRTRAVFKTDQGTVDYNQVRLAHCHIVAHHRASGSAPGRSGEHRSLVLRCLSQLNKGDSVVLLRIGAHSYSHWRRVSINSVGLGSGCRGMAIQWPAAGAGTRRWLVTPLRVRIALA
jgi:hypothetical protein